MSAAGPGMKGARPQGWPGRTLTGADKSQRHSSHGWREEQSPAWCSVLHGPGLLPPLCPPSGAKVSTLPGPVTLLAPPLFVPPFPSLHDEEVGSDQGVPRCCLDVGFLLT